MSDNSLPPTFPALRYSVLAIPLNRAAVIDYLLTPQPASHGADLAILGQRPTAAAERRWIDHLHAVPVPAADDLLRIDHPANHLRRTQTDRLVPVQFLREPDFLTRNLGGWSPIYFAVTGLPQPWCADPLLEHATVLVDYGPDIRAFGADPVQVAARLGDEVGLTAPQVAGALQWLHAQRPPGPVTPDEIANHAELLYAHIAEGARMGPPGMPPIPQPLLLDELLGWLVRLELAKRDAEARGNAETAVAIATWQAAQAEATGLRLILKGEYIVGRHRRSTVLIAPELGVVVKQPGPEPFHEIVLGAHTHNGTAENWPTLTHDKSLVTPRGRIRQVIEEGLIPRLHQVLHHPMDFYTLLGITVEPFVVGPTTQELVLRDPDALTPELYAVYVLHQQVAEILGVENGDWHAANFVVREGDGRIVHIDWGAARPLRDDEHTPQGCAARLNQVKNIAYSFHDPDLAARVERFHHALVNDPIRMDAIRRRAVELCQ